MEYILISEDKLKIILTRQELDARDVSVDELDYENPLARGIVEGLLDYAKDNLGFDTSKRKLLIQLFPSRDGGCELFVTRLGKKEDKSKENRSGDVGRKVPRVRPRAFSFESLGGLLSLCKRLKSSGYLPQGSVWVDLQGQWFLTLTGEDTELDRVLGVIAEYGEEQSYTATSLYLCEHARELYSGVAIAALGNI